MTRSRMSSSVLAGVATAVLLMVALGSHMAYGHGSMKEPISRAYNCYLEITDNTTSDACGEAAAVSIPEAFNDWDAVLILDAAGRHRQLIPDGQLCSAGRAKYAGLDLARADWEGASLASGVNYTFLYKATVAHKGFFEFYVTKDGYDATQALTWSDLEDAPFVNVTDPTINSDNDYEIAGTTPAGKSGRHVIYVIWQRTDISEAFYSCSDVDFDDTSSDTVLHAST